MTTIAGLPVQIGLYTALVPLLVYALLGTSRALSVSTTSTLAALTAAAVATVANGDPDRAISAATTLAMLTGLLLLAAGALKLGFLADFISHPVLAGFKAGTGLLIAGGQIGKLLGIEETGDNFFEKIRSAVEHLGDIDGATAGLGVATVAGLLDVALTGSVPSGLPSPIAPDLDLIGPLLPAAAGLALMSFVESIAAGRAVTHVGEHDPNPDRELIALGAANLAGGVFRGFPAGGGLSQTAVNDGAGAQTRVAGAVTGGVALLTVLFLTGVFADLPQATLGALVFVSAIGLITLQPLKQFGTIHRYGFWLGLLTLVSVLALGVLQGVLVGVLASMLSLVHALNHPDIRVLSDDGDTLVLRIVGPLYFANMQRVRAQLNELVREHRPRVLELEMSGVGGLDITALAILPSSTVSSASATSRSGSRTSMRARWRCCAARPPPSCSANGSDETPSGVIG